MNKDNQTPEEFRAVQPPGNFHGWVEQPELKWQAQWYTGTTYHEDGYERGGYYATKEEALEGAKLGKKNQMMFERIAAKVLDDEATQEMPVVNCDCEPTTLPSECDDYGSGDCERFTQAEETLAQIIVGQGDGNYIPIFERDLNQVTWTQRGNQLIVNDNPIQVGLFLMPTDAIMQPKRLMINSSCINLSWHKHVNQTLRGNWATDDKAIIKDNKRSLKQGHTVYDFREIDDERIAIVFNGESLTVCLSHEL